MLSSLRRRPVVLSLLRDNDEIGCAAVDLAEYSGSEQHYLENTAILTTRLFDRQGGCVEVTDFAPRFGQYGRIFRPMMLVRRIAPGVGQPRLTLRLRPACGDESPALKSPEGATMSASSDPISPCG